MVGGVEGGVPGGVVGGVVGGLPTAVPPPPAPVVRIGGKIAPPRIIHRVEPVYPALATAARIGAIVVLEAEVDTRGYVKSVRVLSGHPLFDEAASEAVKQWRYQPLLLNGEPTGFILSVVVTFALRTRLTASARRPAGHLPAGGPPRRGQTELRRMTALIGAVPIRGRTRSRHATRRSTQPGAAEARPLLQGDADRRQLSRRAGRRPQGAPHARGARQRARGGAAGRPVDERPGHRVASRSARPYVLHRKNGSYVLQLGDEAITTLRAVAAARPGTTARPRPASR